MRFRIVEELNITQRIIDKLSSLGYTYEFFEKGWYDENNKKIEDFPDDWEPGENDWYYYSDFYIFEKGPIEISWHVDENNKNFIIHKIWAYTGSTRGEATKILETCLNEIPNGWTIQILNNINPEYWYHIQSKYPQHKWENIEEGINSNNINEKLGYRTETAYGSGVRKLEDIIDFEIAELDNTDIPDTLLDTYDMTNKQRRILTEFSDNSEDFDDKEKVVKTCIDIIKATYPKVKYALWLADKDVVKDLYNGEDDDIDSYEIPNTMPISDLGRDGQLYVYEELPNPISINENFEYKTLSNTDKFKKDTKRVLGGYGADLSTHKEILKDGKLIGYIAFETYDGEESDNFDHALGIGDFMILERGKSYGTEVIKDIINKYKNKYDLIYCYVDEENLGGINFYKKLGKVYDELNSRGQYYVELYKNTQKKINENIYDENEQINNEYDLLDWMNKNITYELPETEYDDASKFLTKTPEEVLETGTGHCAEQSYLEKEILDNLGYKTKLIYVKENNSKQDFGYNGSAHVFVIYKKNDEYYWFEHAMEHMRGIHKYNSLDDLFTDVAKNWWRYEDPDDDVLADVLEFREMKEPITGVNNKQLAKQSYKGKLIATKSIKNNPLEKDMIDESYSDTSIIAYHGSPNKFTKFDLSKSDKNNNILGKGIYFLDKKDLDVMPYITNKDIKYLYTCKINLGETYHIHEGETADLDEIKEGGYDSITDDSSKVSYGTYDNPHLVNNRPFRQYLIFNPKNIEILDCQEIN